MTSGKQTSLDLRPDDDDDDCFNWTGEDVIIQEQPQTAVYRNVNGGVVIRQRLTSIRDEDQFVFFGTDDAVALLIKALQRQIGGAR